ncbi:MAG: phosphoribosylglycinamide formyltransferase [Phycisphaerales bacterium]
MPPAIPSAPKGPARVAGMLSGSGRTLLNLLDHIENGSLAAIIPIVIASRECLGAQRARDRGVPEVLVMPGEIPAEKLGSLLRANAIEWVALAGYLKLIHVPRGYEGRIVNIHPALLPDFGGSGMYGERVHEAVIRSGASESGCTVHLCDAEYDRGPIILQKRCPVRPDDTAHTLADRVFALEREAYPQALQLLIASGVVPNQMQSGAGKNHG